VLGFYIYSPTNAVVSWVLSEIISLSVSNAICPLLLCCRLDWSIIWWTNWPIWMLMSVGDVQWCLESSVAFYTFTLVVLIVIIVVMYKVWMNCCTETENIIVVLSLRLWVHIPAYSSIEIRAEAQLRLSSANWWQSGYVYYELLPLSKNVLNIKAANFNNNNNNRHIYKAP